MLFLFASTAFGDMGRVLVNQRNVNVGEDAQKAVILHNGREVAVVFGTELNASRMSAPGSAFRRLVEATDARCALPPERGPCKAHIEAHHFNRGKRTCEPFFWGGCGPAPFNSKDECEKACAHR